MSSTLPSRANGYKISPKARADRALFEHVFGDIDARLLPVEGKSADYDAAINLIVNQALATVSATLGEEVATQRAVLTAIQVQAEELLDEYASRSIPATRVLLDVIPDFAAQTVQAAIQQIVTEYVRKDGSSGTVQIGTTNGNDGALRLAFRTSGFTSSIEALNADGNAVGLICRSENNGAPFWIIRVANTVNDTFRFYADGLRGVFGGIERTFWNTANAPEATDAEADAGSVGAARMWSPARLWRAVRAALPLVSQSVAEAGADTVARSWSVLRVWQAIRAALPLPSAAEIDAGTATDPRSISASLLFRAARAALPLATQAIAEAGTDLVARSWSALAVRQAAVAADRMVLLEGWDAARLGGLSTIERDLDPAFSYYVIKFGGLRLQSGTSTLGLRCGAAGGALNNGASDYQQIVHQFRGGASAPDATTSSNPAFALFGLSTGGAMFGEVTVQDGREGFWTAQYQGGGLQSDGQLVTGTRNGRYVQGGGRQGRLQIAFGAALAANGFVQIFGVR